MNPPGHRGAAARAELGRVRRLPRTGHLTLDNLRDIDQAIDLPRTLLNSGIFTGGVLLCTLVLGLLAGYALARLEFRGKGMVLNAMLLILIVPFQLLKIPLYVMIVLGYLLGDTYLGMILPFAANATAVFIGGPPRRSPGPPRR